MIYLDNAATTKPFENVIQCMYPYYADAFFNPSALYVPAIRVADEIERARTYIENFLGGGGKLYFTSGATESNTWVYQCGVKNKKGNIVVSMGEHASGYENAQALLGKGQEVRYVRLQSDGTVDRADFLRKIDKDTTLVSVIHCSNETGAVNDLYFLSQAIKQIAPRALFHSDGVQALAKIPVNCRDSGVDLYSISAHKIGGVKGVGALWVRDGIHLQPLLKGGGQEAGARAGTENAAGIIGFAEALKTFSQIDVRQIERLRSAIKDALLCFGDVSINEAAYNSPYILSFSACGIRAEHLQRNLAEKEILIGLGSACSSRHKNNRVLAAMGRSMSHIEGSARISFGVSNLQDDINYVASVLTEGIKNLHTMQRGI